MDESANKGLESKGSSDAEIPKRRSIMKFRGRPKLVTMVESAVEEELNDSYAGSSVITRMVVKGYDTSLPRDDVEEALRKHFASCGINLIHASVPLVEESLILCSHALIYVYEEYEAEALKLQGSEMGEGCILEITAYPFDDDSLDQVFAPTKVRDLYQQRTLLITGFDTSLDDDDVVKMIREIFPVCRPMVFNDGTDCTVFLHLHGQDAMDKALKLSGSSVGNSLIKVTSVLPRRKPVRCGFSLATRLAMSKKSLNHISM